MSLCTRRFLGGGVAGAACLTALRARAEAGRGAPRVVVIGGGAGGATVARYLAMASTPLSVTLVEPKRQYTTCFFSNLHLAGLWPLQRLTHGYERLAEAYGIRVIHDLATAIDPAARTVQLGEGGSIAYDRLVVAPGIGFRALAGYDEAAAEAMPHAWMAGPQTQLLRRQIEAMPDGGTFLMTVPDNPYRCPPGPYERASMIAAYFRAHKPRAKILIVDAKDTFFEQDLFEEAWRRHYPGMIEWLPVQFAGAVTSVHAGHRSVTTANQTFRGDVVNIIPPQRAADLAQHAGLADASGWCPVEPQGFESRLHRDVHLVGDAIEPGAMPKSAFAANSQAKACAAAIVAALTGAPASQAFLFNTCYTFLAPDDAVCDAISFKASGSGIDIAALAISALDEKPQTRAQTVREAEAWYDAFTRDMFG